MKLLQRTRRPFLIYAACVMLLTIPMYYHFLETQALDDVDEDLLVSLRRVERNLNAQHLTPADLTLVLERLNQLDAGIRIDPLPAGAAMTDEISTIVRHDEMHGHEEPFRTLVGTIHANGRPYRATVTRVIEETDELVIGIAVVSLCTLVLLFCGVLLLDRITTRRLWAPFERTLSALKRFQVDGGSPLTAEATGIVEFDELNRALEQLTERNIAIYAEQRRFTENAAHEMRTPLAILQGKVDRLFQTPALTEDQAVLLEGSNDVLARMRRLYDALVLLARIDNDPAPAAGTAEPMRVVLATLAGLSPQTEEKHLHVEAHGDIDLQWNIAPALAEVLINNLITNAVRHTAVGGTVMVDLSAARLQVSNSGSVPLDPNTLFTRFSGSGRGLGLGTAIARRVCERRHWDIRYDFVDGSHVFTVRTTSGR